ncbi:hypothetical protein KSD_58890 [Ktedonobacter sp. SOSP1-85]|uniref:hypothetical protein n=1 Tax=Ktedonobacter sp. SOSP1-85 TaxID=2778367 RepID=UPI0019166B1F|nr:hypothetical protein [Ktedonobacter sp. SOSP1-85]GHO78118.1 hypothetical protein KSD_58890 [Ktedonobacter sp. SOSP1-85]
MPAIYHACPVEMQENMLYPLNGLKALYPELYQREIAKYRDHPSRYDLPQLFVPKLNCRWSDVVFCSPIHPYLIYKELQARGFTLSPDKTFFQIPIEAIRGLPTAIYYDSNAHGVAEALPEEAVAWLKPESYQELERVPEETLAWYDHLKSVGRNGAYFVGVPHVLVKGAISIKEARIVRWSEKI